MIDIVDTLKPCKCCNCNSSFDVKGIKVEADELFRAKYIPLCLQCRKILATKLVKELRQ